MIGFDFKHHLRGQVNTPIERKRAEAEQARALDSDSVSTIITYRKLGQVLSVSSLELLCVRLRQGCIITVSVEK